MAKYVSIGQLQGEIRKSFASLKKYMDENVRAPVVSLAAQAKALADEVVRRADEGEFKGEPGSTGAPGSPGAPGPAGPTGAPGRDGQDGAPGRDGQDGAPGRDGQDGAPGRDGQDGHSPVVEARRHPQQPVTLIIVDGVQQAYIRDGATGAKGDTGATGAQGPAGAKGDKGDKGDQGEPGSDAEVTAANIASALGYTPVSPADYNPDSKTAAMTQSVGKDADGKLWTVPGGGGGGDAVWGGITGTLSDQTDLAEALAGKVPTTAYAPVTKSAGMTQPVGKDANGKLWTAPPFLPAVNWGDITGDLEDQTDLAEALAGAAYDDTALSGRVTAIEGKESGWDGKYSKPSGGIPKTDLASAVQTSLIKADNAVQPDDMAYHAGDTLSIYKQVFPGQVLQNGTAVRFTVPLPKKSNGLTPSLSSPGLIFSGVAGRLHTATAVSSAAAGLEVETVGDNYITLIARGSQSAPISGTGSTPASVTPYSGDKNNNIITFT